MSSVRRPVTIKDVAKAAGVGISTVSRALNDSGSVHPETRERIRRVTEELGFRPNAVAKSMVTKSSGTLGLVVPDLRNPYFPVLAQGLEDTASTVGYTVMLGNSANDTEREWSFVRTAMAKQVEGLIFTGTATGEDLVRTVLESGVAVVSADITLKHLTDVIWIDHVEGGRLATAHLISLGHRQIAHVAGPHWARAARERFEGYQVAMQEAGLPIDPDLITHGDFQTESGSIATQALFTGTKRPTAIYAGNDLMAIGALKALAQLGIRVPDDVAVIGHGDGPYAAWWNPPLSSVAEPLYEWGRAAMDLLVTRISGEYTGPPRCRLLRPALQVRDSSVARH